MNWVMANKEDLISSAVVLGGITAAVVAAEISAPILAAAGAVATVGAGVYRVATYHKPKSELTVKDEEYSASYHG